jgi:hypothetical protein
MQARLDALNPEFYFDRRVSRYRYTATGRLAPKQAILSLTKTYVATQQRELIQLGKRFADGQVDENDFLRNAAKRLRAIHLSMAVLGKNGHENMTSNDFLIIARELRRQYYTGYGDDSKPYGLRHLVKDWNGGTLSKAQFVNRVNLFSQSGKTSYWAMRESAAIADGKIYAKRTRHASESCPDCMAWALMGIQPAGVLPIPTQRCACKVNCKCKIKYYTLSEVEKIRGIG